MRRRRGSRPVPIQTTPLNSSSEVTLPIVSPLDPQLERELRQSCTLLFNASRTKQRPSPKPEPVPVSSAPQNQTHSRYLSTQQPLPRRPISRSDSPAAISTPTIVPSPRSANPAFQKPPNTPRDNPTGSITATARQLSVHDIAALSPRLPRAGTPTTPIQSTPPILARPTLISVQRPKTASGGSPRHHHHREYATPSPPPKRTATPELSLFPRRPRTAHGSSATGSFGSGLGSVEMRAQTDLERPLPPLPPVLRCHPPQQRRKTEEPAGKGGEGGRSRGEVKRGLAGFLKAWKGLRRGWRKGEKGG